MAAYPSLLTLRESAIEVEGGFDPARATNGSLRVRRLYDNDKASFEVRHLLTPAEKTTLDTFYAAERLADVTYTWPADRSTYTVRFVAAPQYRRVGNHWEATVRLAEV